MTRSTTGRQVVSVACDHLPSVWDKSQFGSQMSLVTEVVPLIERRRVKKKKVLLRWILAHHLWRRGRLSSSHDLFFFFLVTWKADINDDRLSNCDVTFLVYIAPIINCRPMLLPLHCYNMYYVHIVSKSMPWENNKRLSSRCVLYGSATRCRWDAFALRDSVVLPVWSRATVKQGAHNYIDGARKFIRKMHHDYFVKHR